MAAPTIKPRKIAAVQQSYQPAVTPPAAPEKPAAPASLDHPAPSVDDPSDDRPVPSESALAEESKLIADATQKLNHGGDAAGALAVLDRYRSRFPDGKLAAAALVQRVKALRALSRGAEAMALLDRSEGLDNQLRLLRGELRAENGRCDDALSDFDATLDSPKSGGFEERALYGRASCRSRTGHPDDARRDLERLIERFPSGKLAAEARRALAE
jgi:tetratricopeptide (TPR) repeat protein